MITKSQKNKLKKHLKTTWLEDVIKLLETKGVTNKQGESYSEQMIKAVRYGLRENMEIEAAILDVYDSHKTLIENHEEQKRQILSA